MRSTRNNHRYSFWYSIQNWIEKCRSNTDTLCEPFSINRTYSPGSKIAFIQSIISNINELAFVTSKNIICYYSLESFIQLLILHWLSGTRALPFCKSLGLDSILCNRNTNMLMKFFNTCCCIYNKAIEVSSSIQKNWSLYRYFQYQWHDKLFCFWWIIVLNCLWTNCFKLKLLMT